MAMYFSYENSFFLSPSQVPAPPEVAHPVQALPWRCLLAVRLLSTHSIPRPMEGGDHVAFSEAHISPWNVILGSLPLRLLSVLTTKPAFRHPKSGLCNFTHCSTHSKTFSCSVIHLCEVTWSTAGNGKGKVGTQWAWSVGVSLRTRLSLSLSHPYSLQWSSAGTLIPTLKRIVLSLFLIKV